MDKERQAVNVQSKARSRLGWYSPAPSCVQQTAPIQRQEMGVCVSIEEGKQKAEGMRSERREKGQVTSAVTRHWPFLYTSNLTSAAFAFPRQQSQIADG